MHTRTRTSKRVQKINLLQYGIATKGEIEKTIGNRVVTRIRNMGAATVVRGGASALFLVAVHFVVFATTAGEASSLLGGVNLIGEGFEGPFAYGSPEMDEAVAAANATGVRWICLSFPARYTEGINSTGPFYEVPGGTPTGAPFHNASTPTLAGVEATIRSAQQQGLKVVLRPMLDPDWRLPQNQGGVSRSGIGAHFNDAEWAAWFVSYEAFLSPWVDMAQHLRVDGFCFGAELGSSEQHANEWRRIAAAVRLNYTVPGGVVYYSTDTYARGGFPWEVSDVLAFDVYPNLQLANPDPVQATVPELVEAWQPTLDTLANVSAQHGGKLILVQETGICSIDKSGLYTQPWFFDCYTYPANEDVQAKFYEALFLTVWRQPWAAGVFFWKWALQGGLEDQTFFPLNKTAGEVMAKYFG